MLGMWVAGGGSAASDDEGVSVRFCGGGSPGRAQAKRNNLLGAAVPEQKLEQRGLISSGRRHFGVGAGAAI